MMEPVVGSLDCLVTYTGFPREVVIYAIRGADVVYVGSTSQSIRHRMRIHIADAKKGSWLPIHQWMRDADFKFEVLMLERVPESDRVAAEREWMARFNGALLNLTDGGPGMSGFRYAGSEHALRIAKSLQTGGHFNCLVCEASFWRKRVEAAKGNNKFCSRTCYQTWQRGKPKKGGRIVTEAVPT